VAVVRAVAAVAAVPAVVVPAAVAAVAVADDPEETVARRATPARQRPHHGDIQP